MGYLRYPSYYPQFRCTASACTHNCCLAGWEIDIDDETLAYYQQVSGACGDRLRTHIALPSEEQAAHIILDEQGRCPFLGRHNLCDIYTELGAEHLCEICTEHPRYYDWFSGGTEAGVGLCCEAAAELILQKTGIPTLESVPDDGFEPEEISEEERDAEYALFRMRDELFHIIKTELHLSPDERMNRLYCAAARMQAACDAWMFPDTTQAAPVRGWTDAFWQPEQLNRLLDCFLALEINDSTWRDLLCRTKAQLPELLRHRQAFLSFYQKYLYEYEQLLIYFLYRHFMGARWDGALCGRVNFALISTCMIQLLDIQSWLADGCLPHTRQIDLCRRYSEEIEYDEDNTETLFMYPVL